MIELKNKVYRAEILDLGYSGVVRPPNVIGFFTDEDVARRIARDLAGNEVQTGQQGHVVETTFAIEIFESLDEYLESKIRELVTIARSKLSDEELVALTNHILMTRS